MMTRILLMTLATTMSINAMNEDTTKTTSSPQQSAALSQNENDRTRLQNESTDRWRSRMENHSMQTHKKFEYEKLKHLEAIGKIEPLSEEQRNAKAAEAIIIVNRRNNEQRSIPATHQEAFVNPFQRKHSKEDE